MVAAAPRKAPNGVSNAGNAKHVRIRQGIAEQRLKAGSGYGERGTDNDAEKNARQADIHDNQAVIAGDSAALPENNTQQVASQRIKRNRHGAKLQGEDHDKKQVHQKEQTLEEEAMER